MIHGDRFAAIADIEINRNAHGAWIVRGLALLGRGARIVFVKTDFISQVFAFLSRMPHPEPFILITHNSDLPITRRLFESAPACVFKWYAVNVDHHAPQLIPIPIGMERPGGGGYSADYSQVPAAWQANTGAGRQYLACGCWNTATNAPERSMARKSFEGRPAIVWRELGLSHHDFLRMCGESRFVISPPATASTAIGPGKRCTWERFRSSRAPTTPTVS